MVGVAAHLGGKIEGGGEAGLADELNVAPLSVGAWAWGSTRLWGHGKEYNRGDVGKTFRASMGEGVTLLGTAEMFDNGASERIIGRYCARVVSRGHRS